MLQYFFLQLRPCFACPNKCSSLRVTLQNQKNSSCWVADFGESQKGKAPFSPPQAFVAAAFCDITTGLKIIAYEQTMSSQNGNLSSQKFHLPVMLTSNAHSHSWTNRIKPTLTCKSKILSFCKNTNRKFHKDLTFFPIHFDWSEMKLKRANISSASLVSGLTFKNYFKPCNVRARNNLKIPT